MFGINIIEKEYSPAFYTAKDMMLLFSISRVTLYKLMKHNKIPQPIRLSGGIKSGKLRWQKDTIDNFINGLSNEMLQETCRNEAVK